MEHYVPQSLSGSAGCEGNMFVLTVRDMSSGDQKSSVTNSRQTGMTGSQ